MRRRFRGSSLSTVAPSPFSPDYSSELASIAARIIYRSPLRSAEDLPIYILNSAAFPDSNDVSYDRLLGYVLARLPEEDELLGGKGYEVIFFAGGNDERGDLNKKKNRPRITWTVQAYNVLGRAMRKRLTRLYLVHERKWVRLATEVFSTIVSPKFRRKVEHASTLSQLALHVPIQDLLIPPSVYVLDRKFERQVYAPYATGTRAFRATIPMPRTVDGSLKLPRVLREATSFVVMHGNIEAEGLFRANARAITLEILKEAYDRGQKFIVWREGDLVMNFPQWKEGYGDVTVHDVDEVEGYPVYAAAGLIKLWYAELKNPIFVESSYQYIEREYGGADSALSHDKLVDLVGPESEWSQINTTNRQILTLHLLPLLSMVSKHSENKMTPKALAICFAPSLLCGSDPVRDARMCGVVSKIIEYAITEWTNGLRERCGLNEADFKRLLEFPSHPEDREDPLDHSAATSHPSLSESNENQSQGITLVDHESGISSGEDEFDEFESVDYLSRPPLPPRGRNDQESSDTVSHDNPPRYSTIITSQRTQSPPELSQAQLQPANVVSRKPTPARSRAATSESIRVLTEMMAPENLPINSISLDSGERNNEMHQSANSFSSAGIDYTDSPISLNQNSEQELRTHGRSASGISTSSTIGINRKPLPRH